MQDPKTSSTSTHLNSLYKTSDLIHSVVLVLSGFSLLTVEQSGNRALFIFPASDEINVILAKYHSGELRVDPRQVFDTWKGLRRMTFNVMGDVR